MNYLGLKAFLRTIFRWLVAVLKSTFQTYIPVEKIRLKGPVNDMSSSDFRLEFVLISLYESIVYNMFLECIVESVQ
jgi:hypothetical protein